MKYLFIIFGLFFVDALKPNLCINCNFYKKDWLTNNKFGKCLLFPQEKTSDYFFVDGINNKKKIDYHYCATARNLHHMCGEEGQFFIKK